MINLSIPLLFIEILFKIFKDPISFFKKKIDILNNMVLKSFL